MAKQSKQFNIRVDAKVEEHIEKAALHDKILLSKRDYDLFVQLMLSDSEPPPIALKEAAEFNNGRMDGNRYRW